MASENTVPVPSQVRRPRGAVLINGVRVDGWVSIEVENNVYYEADTFHVVFAASNLPVAMNAAWFPSQSSIQVQIFLGIPPNADNYTTADLTSYLTGYVDTVSYDPIAATLTITGRDCVGQLIDTQTVEQYRNKTASDVVQMIAAKHGFTASATPTTTQIGPYYAQDLVKHQCRRSEWDLLCWLAQHEGFVVYMLGNQLVFQQAQALTKTYTIQWTPPGSDGYPSSNVLDIHFNRALTITRGVTVTVKSVHGAHGATYQESYPQQGAKRSQPGGIGVQGENHYIYVRNFTPQQCQERAEKVYRQITDHEMKIEATLSGDDKLRLDTLVQVTGTGGVFDQTYYPKSIRRTLSADDGYLMTLRAQNVSPENEVAG